MDSAIGSSVCPVAFGSFTAAALAYLIVLLGERISSTIDGWPPFNYNVKTGKLVPASPLITSVIPPAFMREETHLAIGSGPESSEALEAMVGLVFLLLESFD